MSADVRIVPEDRWADAVAEACVGALRGAVERRGRAFWALTGGRSPLPAYRRIAESYRDALDWARVYVLLGDERWVPFSHPDSNFGAARGAMLDALPLDRARVLPFPTDAPSPSATAERFAATLHDLFPDDVPAFDLVLLGVGDDGHVASLFPGSPALDEGRAWTAAATAPASMPVHDRVTLTFPALNAARRVFMLATGSGKAEIVARALRAADPVLPVHHLRPAGPLTWWLDPGAAAKLPETL